MKNTIKIILFIFALSTYSCNEWIDPDINIDPSKPKKVTPQLLLPAAQGGIAYSAGGELSRYTGYWMQHITGVQLHAGKHETYGTNEADLENLWRYYTYGGTLMDLHALIDQATEEGSPHYSGVAKVLTAYKLGVTTDMWGDVPYKDAFKGDEGNITATYHTQEEVYTILFELLDEAITDLNAKESTDSPGSDDLIFAGDLQRWVKTAYALKARFSIHLSKVKGDAAYKDALEAIPNAFTSNADNFDFSFGLARAENAPLFQYDEQRGGYIGGVGKYLVDLLKNSGDTDPRLAVYAEPLEDGSYEGHEPGATEANASWIGDWFTKADATVSLITYAELRFIEAEAHFSKASSDRAAAANAYNEAVKASLAQFDVSDTAWEAKNAAETAESITLEKIMKAKYLATFLQDETFNDWRRHTELFGLKLARNAKTDEIPRRFPYPQSEREYNNANMPKDLTITDHNWWDK